MRPAQDCFVYASLRRPPRSRSRPTKAASSGKHFACPHLETARGRAQERLDGGCVEAACNLLGRGDGVGLATRCEQAPSFELVFERLQLSLGGLGDGVNTAQLIGERSVAEVMETGGWCIFWTAATI